jgi:hypothetical protein
MMEFIVNGFLLDSREADPGRDREDREGLERQLRSPRHGCLPFRAL